MCKENREAIDHLLLHCEVPRDLWCLLSKGFGVDWVITRKVKVLLVNCRGQKGHDNILQVWRLAPFYFMWWIWREQNAQIFKDKEASMVELTKIVLDSLYTRAEARDTSLFSSFSDFFELLFLFFISNRSSLVYFLCTIIVPLWLFITLHFLYIQKM